MQAVEQPLPPGMRVVRQPRREWGVTEVVGILRGVQDGLRPLRNDSAMGNAFGNANAHPGKEELTVAELEANVFKRKVDAVAVVESAALDLLAKRANLTGPMIELPIIDITASTTQQYVDPKFASFASQQQLFMNEFAEAMRSGETVFVEGDVDNPNMRQWNTAIPGVRVQMDYFIDSNSQPDQQGRKKTVPGRVLVLGEIAANRQQTFIHIKATTET